MGRIVDEELFKFIHDFFIIYLPEARGCSSHTIRSYQKSLDGFVNFVSREKNIDFSAVTFKLLSNQMLSDYLDSIEKNGGSISTRNNRLNGIRSFFSYVSKVDITKIIYKSDIDIVPLKKSSSDKVQYLSENAVKALFEQPDTRTKKGLRDSFIMLLMYDTAARVSGIVNISICDVALGKNPVITLHEKGSKINTVPIMKQTVEHFLNYMSAYHKGESAYSKEPLFYSYHNDEKCRIDDSTIRKFMKKYADKAREKCREIPENVYPHLLRHSRAMHLYQHGMDLTLVSQWLNHSRLETTLIYAHADTEQKRKAIEKATSSDNPLNERLNSNRFTVDDDDLLKRLYGLK